ncbi:MAG: DUF4765 family protein [Vannielia sp.]|uniref:DUF4765 family protein n=1 Tax=Vannielia sp. TaxID=2813045 RepID=UPI003B8BAAA0
MSYTATTKKPSKYRGRISAESTVSSAKPEDLVLLVRGTGMHRVTAVQKAMSANGDEANEDTPAPDESAVVSQVGGSQSGVTRTKLPEYTTRVDIAENFAKGAILCIAVRRKYLTKGSGTEGGWAVLGTAPVEGVDFEVYGSANAPRLPDAD